MLSLLSVFVLSLSCNPAAGAGLPAFPGAEGFGSETPGGRGGRVIEVTSVTIQWCIVSEGLMDSLHPQGSHSTGILLGNGKNRVTVHHCLLAHNSGRNPLLAADTGPSTIDWRNNVVYNYGSWGCGNARGPSHVNYVGNTIIQGPNGRRPSSLGIDIHVKQRYFVRDNRWPGRPADQVEEWMVLGPRTSPPPDGVLSDVPITVPPVTTESAADAYQSVLRFAGAALPVRDVVDARIIEEVMMKTGAIIDTQADVGGWPEYRNFDVGFRVVRQIP